jgi:tetratricopeptide (TPR) repeat protein
MFNIASASLTFSLVFVSFFIQSQEVATTPTLLQLEDQLKGRPDDTELRQKLAQIYFNNRNFAGVIETLNPYTERINIESHLLLAGAYSEIKKFDEEVRVLKMVTEKDPKNYQVHYIVGSAYSKLSDATEDPFKKKEIQNQSIQALREAINLNRKYQPPYDLLLNTFISNKANYEARTLLIDMIKLFGNRPPYLNDLCRLLSIDGYLQQAIEDCKKAIVASKNFPDNYIYLAQAYFDRDDEKQSEKILIVAAKRFPKSEPVQWTAGEFYNKKKNFPVANRYFKAAVTADPKSVRANVSHANTLLETGRHDEALPFYVTACKIDPNTKTDLATAAAKLRINKKEALAKQFIRARFSCP